VKKRPPLLVAIVGGSGSGKTWLAKRLKRELRGDAAHLSLDHFYRDRSHLSPNRRARLNFDTPACIDWKTFHRVLSAALRSRSIRLPSYDFKTHCRLSRQVAFTPKPIVLVEGLWLLRPPFLRRLFAFAVFLDCPIRKRLRRRLDRDLHSRGRSPVSVRAQFWKTVQPMHKKFVQPQRRRADLIASGDCGEREVEKIAATLRSLRTIASDRG